MPNNKNSKTEQKYVTQQNKFVKSEHHKHGAAYSTQHDEPYTSLNENSHDDLIEMFAEEIYPNEDLGI